MWKGYRAQRIYSDDANALDIKCPTCGRDMWQDGNIWVCDHCDIAANGFEDPEGKDYIDMSEDEDE